jgi:hypothetical protein
LGKHYCLIINLTTSAVRYRAWEGEGKIIGVRPGIEACLTVLVGFTDDFAYGDLSSSRNAAISDCM